MPVNWTTVLTALIAASVPALISGTFSIINGRKLDHIHILGKQIKEDVDGKMEAALQGQRSLGRLEGGATERTEERARVDIKERENG
jgi:hypothetical protein